MTPAESQVFEDYQIDRTMLNEMKFEKILENFDEFSLGQFEDFISKIKPK